MDEVQLAQAYRATTRRQFTFYHSVPRSSWYSLNQPQNDKRLSGPLSHPMVLNWGLLNWESSALTITIIGKTYVKCKCRVFTSIKQTLHYKVAIE